MEITLVVQPSNGDKKTFRVAATMTVADFKGMIASAVDCEVSRQRLIHRGRVLQNEKTLESYGVADNHTLHLVRSSAGSGSPPTTTTSSPHVPSHAGSASTPALPLPTQLQPPQPPATTLPGQNPIAVPPFPFGSMLAGQPGQPGQPDITRMQQQLMQNPEMMQNIMSSPMMQSLLDNPEMIRSMLQSNPQFQAVLEQNPQLNHVFNDPALMRQTMEIARNPAAMREMMRNQDLAISQLENHPEGFNALRRMYHDVQEPLMEATFGSGVVPGSTASGSDSGSGTSDAAPPNTTGPVPNPWASPSTTAPATPSFPMLPTGMPSGPTSNPWAGIGSVPVPGGQGQGSAPLGSGGTPDMNTTMQMMQNPMVQQMMQGFLSNPAVMDQMIASNPMMRAMVDANPGMRAMLQNPEFVRTMTNPEMLRRAMEMQQSFAQMGVHPGMGGLGGLMPPQPTTEGPTATPTPPALNFSTLLGQPTARTGSPGGFPQSGSTAPIAMPPATERFATQLQQLQGMGFTDEASNISALEATYGNINAAIERLLGGQ